MSYTVINGNDNGAGSLRDALAQAVLSPVDFNINFDPAVTVVTLESTLSVNNGSIATININGNGSGVLTITRNVLAADFRIFNIVTSLLNISGVTISNGAATAVGPAGLGGGLNISNSTMIFNDVIITNNTARFGGGIFSNLSNLTMTNVDVAANVATLVPGSSGGGLLLSGGTTNMNNINIYNNNVNGFDGGGIFCNGIILTINNMSLYNNSVTGNPLANNGGGIFIAAGTVTNISNSVIYNNLASRGGGIFITSSSMLNMVNTTISNNIVSDAGAAILFASVSDSSSLINSTISGNSSGTLGAINITANAPASVTLGNTIVAQNTTLDNTPPDISGAFVSLGTNLFGIYDGSTASGIDPTDLSGTQATPLDAMLQPLADNGGPTLTMAIPIDSPAVNAGNDAIIPAGVIYDQRGPFFARISGLSVDIGAFEYVFAVICFAADSLVLVKNILTGIIEAIPVCQIFNDIHLVYSVTDDCYVPIKLNIVTGKIDRLVKITKGLLGIAMPSEDFFLTSGHYIDINGALIKAANIPGRMRIKVPPQDVYSICTETETLIKVNNINVATWAYNSWMTKSKKTGINWTNNQK